MPSPASSRSVLDRATLVRYGGFVGSLALAYAAAKGGAHSPWRPTITPGTIYYGDNGVLMPLAWLAGIVLLVGAWCFGWRMTVTARWAYVTAALWVVPLLFFKPLGSYDVFSYACQGWQQSAGLDPYAGGVDLLGCPWRDAVAPTWLSSPAPYGPVFLVLGAAAAKVGGSLTGTVGKLRLIAVMRVALIGVSLPALARRSGVPLARAVWLALACPLVAIHLVSGAHNDAIMVGFMVAGLALAVTRRPLLAGVLLGLAVGVKATAGVVIPFAVLIVVANRRAAFFANSQDSVGTMPAMPTSAAAGGVGRPGEGRAAALVGEAAKVIVGAVGILVVVSLLSGRGLGWITGLEGSGVSVQWTAPSTAIGMAINLVGPDAVPVTRIIGIVGLAAVLLFMFWRALRGDALRYAGYALAATVVLAPVFHPWYATWPLAVLAPTVQPMTRWLVVPPAVASVLCLPDGYNLALATKSQGAVLMTVFVLYLAGKAVNEAKNRPGRGAGADRRGDQLSRRDA